LAGFVATGVYAAEKGPEIAIIDNKLSVSADAIPLGRLLRLLDRATGMQSKVPPELANRNLSIRFSGLSFDDGVKKIFQGQPFDYVVVQGQGIIVTAISQGSGSEPVPAYAGAPAQVVEQPFSQDIQPPQPPQPFPPVPMGQQPAVIQTPFGPIANPRANQPQAGQPNGFQPNGFPQQNMPSPIFGAPPSFGMPGAANPAGNATPGGNSPLFGNSVPIYQNPGVPNQNAQPPRP
jgi:hypothetical protein